MNTTVKYSIFFWAIYYIAAITILSPAGELSLIAMRVSAFAIPQILIFYLNLIVLQPRYLEKGLKQSYFVWLFTTALALIICFGTLDIYLDENFPIAIRHFEGRSFLFVFVGRMMSLVPPIIISALIRKSLLLQIKTEESLTLKNKMLEAETKTLKAQINPHFLFNTLNNIYSLSQVYNQKTGEAILQLSDILRYVTYDGNEQTVSLGAEIAHIESFIKLQLLRDDDASNIEVKIEVTEPNLKISPLLLLQFIENCFKHSNHHDKINGWIKISIRTEHSTLILEASNSTTGHQIKKDTVGGVGMDNVQRRLNLLYPSSHELILKMDKTYYSSILKIKLTA